MNKRKINQLKNRFKKLCETKTHTVFIPFKIELCWDEGFEATTYHSGDYVTEKQWEVFTSKEKELKDKLDEKIKSFCEDCDNFAKECGMEPDKFFEEYIR